VVEARSEKGGGREGEEGGRGRKGEGMGNAKGVLVGRRGGGREGEMSLGARGTSERGSISLRFCSSSLLIELRSKGREGR